jgi:serine/threonine protein phosphatase PrpC
MVLALVSPQEITIANIGDCKSYVCYCSNLAKAVLISGNHTESNQDDKNRVKNAGGYFVKGRLNGKFPFTRSIGDYFLKDNPMLSKQQQLLTAVPSIYSLRKQDIKMVVLGSSGVWERTSFVLK